jgi:endonuclease-3
MSRPSRPSPRLKRQAEFVVRSLIALYPSPSCALNHRNPYELLVATILSAQCTDARVNLVTPALFERYPTPKSLAAADLEEVETLIHSTGFFRAKAKNLVAMAGQLVDNHGGEVPADLDALTLLPGVGRKTAHVVLGTGFAVASGIVVDTHVKRLSYRLGLTTADSPEVIERELEAVIPRDEWINFSHRLIQHGRTICDARKPLCEACTLREFCPMLGIKTAAKVPKPRPE